MAVDFKVHQVNDNNHNIKCPVCWERPKANSPKVWVAHPNGGENHPLHLPCAQETLKHQRNCPSQGCTAVINPASLSSLQGRVEGQGEVQGIGEKVAIHVLGILLPLYIGRLAGQMDVGSVGKTLALYIGPVQLSILGAKMALANQDPTDASRYVISNSWSTTLKIAAGITAISAAIGYQGGESYGQILKGAAFIGISEIVLLSAHEQMYKIFLEKLRNIA